MKILTITGIRSEYDYLYPVLKELKKSKHDVRIVITGAHLSHHHNETWKYCSVCRSRNEAIAAIK